jgi:hypothetical protein
MHTSTSPPAMAQHLQPRLLLPLLLFLFATCIQGALTSLPMSSNIPGFTDLTTCAKDCITYGGSYNIDKSTGCSSARCICQPHTFSIALSSLAECISAQPDKSGFDPIGCGEESQQDAAAKVLKAACSENGFDVGGVERATATTKATTKATARATSGTGAGTGSTSAASRIEREQLRMFAVVTVATIAIPALMCGMKFNARL